VESTVNSCNVRRGVRGNFLIKMIMEQFKNNKAFDFTCPVLNKSLRFDKFHPNDELLPKILFRPFSYMCKSEFGGKILNSKKIISIATFKVYGERYPNKN
jgi:hypothetical protein